MSDPPRFLLDSNAVDALLGHYDVLREAILQGRATFLWTHITIDELSATPDQERRSLLLNIAAGLCTFVPTGVFVVEASRVSMARIADDPEAFEALRRGNHKHTRDAITAATALFEGATLVTGDILLNKTAKARGVPVMSPADLTSSFRPLE